jgi:RNA polymerase sigma factor (sigma-70 family)
MHEESTAVGIVNSAIARLRAGDEGAREELLRIASSRLHRLSSHILRSFPGVARWEQTDDVFQNASLRLLQSLKHVDIQDAAHFYRLAATQIRRECLDLCRRYQGPEGVGANHATWAPSQDGSQREPGFQAIESSLDPARLAEWSDLHRKIESLPEEEREIVALLWYGGLSHEAAAEALNTSTKTVQRRWRSARLRLFEELNGKLPDASLT